MAYDYDWESLKAHPVPRWFDDAKFGIFIHWGPYSVVGYTPGGKGYAEWLPREMYASPELYNPELEAMFGGVPPEFGYKDIIPHFKAQRWDPGQWAELFQEAGARYVVLTAEHHDGYALWDTRLTPWCATKVGPMRDLVGELGQAVREHGIKYAPSYHRERHPGFFAEHCYTPVCQPWPTIRAEIERVPEAASLYGPFDYGAGFVADYVARWKELEDKYQPDLMWLDHIPLFHERWNPQPDDPKVDAFRDGCMRMIADYYNAAEAWGKQVYVNNKGPRVGRNWPLGVGYIGEDNMKLSDASVKWENPATMGSSYGYMKCEDDNDSYKPEAELIHLLCDTVSKNGNLLLNIGPRADGVIPEGMQRRLRAIGRFLRANGEAIYDARPWHTWGTDDGPVPLRYTRKDGRLFVIVLGRPAGPVPLVGDAGPAVSPNAIQSARVLSTGQPIDWRQAGDTVELLPPEALPDDCAWVVGLAVA